MSRAPTPPQADLDAWISVALGALVAAVYAGVLGHGFVSLDDKTYVVNNPAVNGGLSWEGIVWAFTSVHSSNWIPLTWISHMLDVTGFGLAPVGHHAAAAALHAINSVLLYRVLRNATRGAAGPPAVWPAAVAAALFAVHPTHVESVAWVSERKDVLSTAFLLLTLLAYVRHVRKPGGTRYALVVAAFVCGLLSKAMLVTLPFALLLLDVWPLQRLPWPGARMPDDDERPLGWRGAIVEKLPLFALSAAAAAVTFAVQRSGGAVQSLSAVPLFERLVTAPLAVVRYLGMAVWPRDLACLYPREPIEAATLVWQLPLALLGLLMLTAVAWRLRREQPWLLVGWLWFLETLVPVIGIVQVGEQSIADRYTYVPYIGLYVAAGWASARGFGVSRGSGRVAAFCGAWLAVIGLLAVVASRQVEVWRNSLTLWSHAVAVTDGATAHDQLSVALFERKRLDEALLHARRAAALRPESARIRHNLANTHLALGHAQDARLEFMAAIERDPELAAAQWGLGDLLLRGGQPRYAAGHFAVAVELAPDLMRHATLGALRAEALRRTVADPATRFDEAVAAYRLALDQTPDASALALDLAWALATDPRATAAHRDEALGWALRASGPDPVRALDVLAAAYASAGRFDEAVENSARAATLARTAGSANLEDIEGRLRRYRAGGAYREPARVRSR